MTIIIKKKNPITHTLKVAIATLTVFVAVGLIAKYTKDESPNAGTQPQKLSQILISNSSLLIASIPLQVPLEAHESQWTTALAKAIGGKAEVGVEFGRADVLTDSYAIEVDFLPKWKEGIGQALHYGDVTHLVPVLALVANEPPDEKLMKHIESLCTSKGVKVLLLVPQ